VACEMEVFPGEGHWFSAGAQARVLMRCAQFLGQYL
jgi:dipeptidyl aminopeptidase/acylaminoacyl peptidase